MDINFTESENNFRNEVKDFLKNDYPKHVQEKQNKGIQLDKQDLIDWHKSLHKRDGLDTIGLKSMVVQVGRIQKFIFFKKSLV